MLSVRDGSPLLEAKDLYLRLGQTKDVPVLGGVSLKLAAGEFVSLVGPSGCGKTTLLLALAGLLAPDEGSVEVSGKLITGPPPEIAVVFQDYSRSLFPWLTVRKNVIAGMRRRDDLDRSQQRELAGELLDRVNIGRFSDRYPWELSGGMQQRLALARALAAGSPIICMDEPLASVDAHTRLELQDFVTDILQEFGRTALLVTHDIDEAVYMADRVLVLSARPTAVTWDEPIAIARPRSQLATRESADFLKHRHQVFTLMQGFSEADRGDERGAPSVGNHEDL